jgi:glucose-1-phosphate thymidylyltransferase
MNYKGIVLAGGSGSRLYPVTLGISKHLLPIYDKPLVYYPISVLMLAGIKEILIISTAEDVNNFKKLLGDGSHLGLLLSYIIQDKPEGIAQAFILGEDFIGNHNVALILGDNIFYGQNFSKDLIDAKNLNLGATIFASYVSNPQRFGVVELSADNNIVVSIEEKPEKPKSNYAITGLYFYNNDVIKYSKSLIPSKRGELEITDINKIYLSNKNINVKFLGRGFAWLDAGTHKSLLEASNFVQTIEKRQGLKIACLEEIALNNNWIDKKILIKQYEKYKNNNYGKYLKYLFEKHNENS